MFRRSLNPTLMSSVCRALVDAFYNRPAAALLATPTMHLFTASASAINPNMTLADFTEATFSGYVPSGTLITPVGPVLSNNSDAVMVHKEANFTADTSMVPPGQTILGYWIDNGESDPEANLMLLAELFDEPVQIVNPFDSLSVDVCFPVQFSVELG